MRKTKSGEAYNFCAILEDNMTSKTRTCVGNYLNIAEAAKGFMREIRGYETVIKVWEV